MIDLVTEAEEFMRHIDENVELYKIFKKLYIGEECEEADKFEAYWTMCSYNKYPHALITLYENLGFIDNSFGEITAENSFQCLQYMMKNYYLLLKDNHLIGE